MKYALLKTEGGKRPGVNPRWSINYINEDGRVVAFESGLGQLAAVVRAKAWEEEGWLSDNATRVPQGHYSQNDRTNNL